MAQRKPKKSRASPHSADEGREVLRELESLGRLLEELNGAVRRLHDRLSSFLPKMAGPAADEVEEEPSPKAAATPDVDRLVDDQFREIFGDESEAAPAPVAGEGEESADAPVEEAPSPKPTATGTRKHSVLWLRLQQGKRVLEVPWSWVKDVSAREIEEQARGVGRIRLEDETGEADIPVDRVLGVALSPRRSTTKDSAYRPGSVQDLVLSRTAHDSATGREPVAPDASELEMLRGSRVVVASPSGIVRRFLRRHLEAMGLVVLEVEDPLQLYTAEDLLGVFWDRDLSQRDAGPPDGHPVVYLSHQVQQSGLSPEGDAPLLAKPFSRDEVARAVVWMHSQSGLAEVESHDESQSGTDASASPADRGDTPSDSPA